MKPTNNQKLTGGWKFIIASLSVTSIVGLINLFSTKDVKTVDSQAIDAILARPIPTLVPVFIASNPVSAAAALTPTSVLREVGQIASTPAPVKQAPVIQKVGGGGSSGSGSSTSTSSSRK
jgi:hypothetical protein